MKIDFLNNFTKRMKNVGAYALLFKNSNQKQTWKQYAFDTIHEQTNVIFSVMLYIMEQSLKEDNCTILDIAEFVDEINMNFYKKPMTHEDCKVLADFIVNSVLCDDGKAMYFDGYDYTEAKYLPIHISFVANKIVYLDGEVKRTSYYLTDDGYSLLLSTLEVETNLKFTIHEMIFKLHLEKASYDKAAADIRDIFNLLRMQLQKIQEAMRKVRQNALTYSVEEYDRILTENIHTIDETNKKFRDYRIYVNKLVKELEQKNINIERLDSLEEANLKNLKIIESYLNLTLDEHQKILSSHFDLKSLYTKELEELSRMSSIQRFQLRNELYQQILEDPSGLSRLDYFLRPLFVNEIGQIYNLKKAALPQKLLRRRIDEEFETIVGFDSEEYQKEVREKQLQKLSIYKNSLSCLLRHVCQHGSSCLSRLKCGILANDEMDVLMPTVEIFREIMIELIKEGRFDFAELRKEQQEHFSEISTQFQINQCLLDVLEEYPQFSAIHILEVTRISSADVVVFDNVKNEHDKLVKIKCSDVSFRIE